LNRYRDWLLQAQADLAHLMASRESLSILQGLTADGHFQASRTPLHPGVGVAASGRGDEGLFVVFVQTPARGWRA